MSKTSNSIVAAAERAGVTVDEYMAAEEELRRQEREWNLWEYMAENLSDRALDRLDRPDYFNPTKEAYDV
jgi:hypothetical protein